MIGRGSLAVAAILAAAPLRAAPPSAQAFGSATATVIRPLTVAPLAVMDFGTITNAPGAGGTATVSPGTAGARFTGATSAVCSGADCGQAHAAAFRVSGEPMRDYTISLPASVVATDRKSVV